MRQTNPRPTDVHLAALHKQADNLFEVDRSLAMAVTDLLEDVQATRRRLPSLLQSKVPALVAMQGAAEAAHDVYARQVYDLCEQLLDKAETADETERAADERDRRYQLAVGQ